MYVCDASAQGFRGRIPSRTDGQSPSNSGQEKPAPTQRFKYSQYFLSPMSSAQFIMVHSWMTSFTALLMADRRTPSELNNKQAINVSTSMSSTSKPNPNQVTSSWSENPINRLFSPVRV